MSMSLQDALNNAKRSSKGMDAEMPIRDKGSRFIQRSLGDTYATSIPLHESWPIRRAWNGDEWFVYYDTDGNPHCDELHKKSIQCFVLSDKPLWPVMDIREVLPFYDTYEEARNDLVGSRGSLIKAECPPVDKMPKSAWATQVDGSHYTTLAVQPFEYSMRNKLDPMQHTIIKYVTRFRDKNGIQDLLKARDCIDMLIEFEAGIFDPARIEEYNKLMEELHGE